MKKTGKIDNIELKHWLPETPAQNEVAGNVSGDKRYELSNHLGNVLNVVTDRKLPEESVTEPGTVGYYMADVVSFSDYDPFGMQLIGRHGTQGYRYGFNGMESDDEVKGNGNSYDFGAMLDPRIGRWLTIDPLAGKQPDQSPYKAFYNNPLYWTDPNGETEYEVTIIVDEKNHTTTKMSVIKSGNIRTDGKRQTVHVGGDDGGPMTQFNYYSYSNVTKYVRATDGSITVTKSMEILYDHDVQKTTGWKGKILDPSGFEMAGGLYMTGKDGQGTKYYSKNAKYVGDVDKLISLLKTYSASAKLNIPKEISQGSQAWDGVTDIMDAMEKSAGKIDKVWDFVDMYKDGHPSSQSSKNGKEHVYPGWELKDTIISSVNGDSSKFMISTSDPTGSGTTGLHKDPLSKKEVKERYPTVLK